MAGDEDTMLRNAARAAVHLLNKSKDRGGGYAFLDDEEIAAVHEALSIALLARHDERLPMKTQQARDARRRFAQAAINFFDLAYDEKELVYRFPDARTVAIVHNELRELLHSGAFAGQEDRAPTAPHTEPGCPSLVIPLPHAAASKMLEIAYASASALLEETRRKTAPAAECERLKAALRRTNALIDRACAKLKIVERFTLTDESSDLLSAAIAELDARSDETGNGF